MIGSNAAAAWSKRLGDNDSSGSVYINRLWQRQHEFVKREDEMIERAKHESYSLPAVQRAALAAPGDSGGFANMFHSHVRPAINRGKTVLLATDPEKHVQMMRERLERQEQRNRRKAPVRLQPIMEIKSLNSPAAAVQAPATRGHWQRRRPDTKPDCLGEEGLAQVWGYHEPTGTEVRSPLTWNISMYPSTGVLQSMPLNSMLNYTRNVLQLDPIRNGGGGAAADAVRVLQTSGDFRTDARRALRSQQGRLYQGFGSYADRRQRNGYSPTFLLEAKSLGSDDGSLPSMLSSSLSRSNNSSVASRHADRRQQQLTESAAAGGATQTKTSLVIELPRIDFIPSTPNDDDSGGGGGGAASRVSYGSRRLTMEKVAKQRELREREIRNLFADIGELNSVNASIQSGGSSGGGGGLAD